MKTQIKRIDKSLPLPSYQTPGAVGFDLYAREEVIISPGEIKLVPLNIIIKIPPGTGLFLFSRSSVPLKKHLMVGNGVGIIDQDFCGEEDEVKVQLFNFGKDKATVEKGERIAQAVIMKFEKVEFEEVEKMSQVSRGGFGSTGKS